MHALLQHSATNTTKRQHLLLHKAKNATTKKRVKCQSSSQISKQASKQTKTKLEVSLLVHILLVIVVNLPRTLRLHIYSLFSMYVLVAIFFAYVFKKKIIRIFILLLLLLLIIINNITYHSESFLILSFSHSLFFLSTKYAHLAATQ